jgi:hypothetical protein
VKKRVNKYPRAFQLMALERMKHCENVSALAKELGIDRTVLYHWKNHLKAIEGGAADSPIRELRKQVRDLKRVLAEKTVEVDFFKGALQKSRLGARATTALARRHLRTDTGNDSGARWPECRANV